MARARGKTERNYAAECPQTPLLAGRFKLQESSNNLRWGATADEDGDNAPPGSEPDGRLSRARTEPEEEETVVRSMIKARPSMSRTTSGKPDKGPARRGASKKGKRKAYTDDEQSDVPAPKKSATRRSSRATSEETVVVPKSRPSPANRRRAAATAIEPSDPTLEASDAAPSSVDDPAVIVDATRQASPAPATNPAPIPGPSNHPQKFVGLAIPPHGTAAPPAATSAAPSRVLTPVNDSSTMLAGISPSRSLSTDEDEDVARRLRQAEDSKPKLSPKQKARAVTDPGLGTFSGIVIPPAPPQKPKTEQIAAQIEGQDKVTQASGSATMPQSAPKQQRYVNGHPSAPALAIPLPGSSDPSHRHRSSPTVMEPAAPAASKPRGARSASLRSNGSSRSSHSTVRFPTNPTSKPAEPSVPTFGSLEGRADENADLPQGDVPTVPATADERQDGRSSFCASQTAGDSMEVAFSGSRLSLLAIAAIAQANANAANSHSTSFCEMPMAGPSTNPTISISHEHANLPASDHRAPFTHDRLSAGLRLSAGSRSRSPSQSQSQEVRCTFLPVSGSTPDHHVSVDSPAFNEGPSTSCSAMGRLPESLTSRPRSEGTAESNGSSHSQRMTPGAVSSDLSAVSDTEPTSEADASGGPTARRKPLHMLEASSEPRSRSARNVGRPQRYKETEEGTDTTDVDETTLGKAVLKGVRSRARSRKEGRPTVTPKRAAPEGGLTDSDTDSDAPVRSRKSKPKRVKTASAGGVIDDDGLPDLQSIFVNGILPSHLEWRLQATNCVKLPSTRRCASCVGRQAHYVCSFKNMRAWVYDKRDNKIAAGPTFDLSFLPAPTFEEPLLPTCFNRSPTEVDLDGLRIVIAPVLQPLLTWEARFVRSGKVVNIGRELKHRLECDGCGATILGGAFLCRNCAREMCVRCHAILGMDDRTIAEAGREDPRNAIAKVWLTELRTCKRTTGRLHDQRDFFRVFHANEANMDKLRKDVDDFLHSDKVPAPNVDTSTFADRYGSRSDSSNAYVRIDADELDGDPGIFESIWSRGETLVVTGMAKRFTGRWKPNQLADDYGHIECKVSDCREAFPKPRNTTVGEFFESFGKARSESEPIDKLKDWPPSTDFKNHFPALFRDFENALPIPDVTRRDGLRNIAAHFASNGNVPDIGPKMYIAMASSDTKGTHGSTKLHMDVADAINVQLWTAVDGDDTRGSALWHIYSPEETRRVRTFLYARIAASLKRTVEEVMSSDDDPIHTQRYYLDVEMRQTLRDEYDVKGWEIYQKKGEAVFIPAYCAHQVCNLADCVKVAADFVSVQSVSRCLTLTEEFQKQTHEAKRAWRDDVLSLPQMLLYAFLSASRPAKQLGGPAATPKETSKTRGKDKPVAGR